MKFAPVLLALVALSVASPIPERHHRHDDEHDLDRRAPMGIFRSTRVSPIEKPVQAAAPKRSWNPTFGRNKAAQAPAPNPRATLQEVAGNVKAQGTTGTPMKDAEIRRQFEADQRQMQEMQKKADALQASAAMFKKTKPQQQQSSWWPFGGSTPAASKPVQAPIAASKPAPVAAANPPTSWAQTPEQIALKQRMDDQIARMQASKQARAQGQAVPAGGLIGASNSLASEASSFADNAAAIAAKEQAKNARMQQALPWNWGRSSAPVQA